MKVKIGGSVRPPSGTPGANSAFLFDLVLEIDDNDEFFEKNLPLHDMNFILEGIRDVLRRGQGEVE